MPEPDTPVLIYATFPTSDDAERIGGHLVDQSLAACVNIIPGLVSIYVWEGKRQRDQETAMLIKSRRSIASQVVAEVRRLHPYDNPALVVLPIEGGSQSFLDWIVTQTSAVRSNEPT